MWQYLCLTCGLSENAVALHARLCWAVWGLKVQLTQTCDITVKDEYILGGGGGGAGGRGAKREKCPGQEMEEAVLSMSGKHF